ncbi:hypothetical protein ML093_000884 [Klebsiella pneumoniae]|nr:hypothetical protein [Klebsiella pneumoniae]
MVDVKAIFERVGVDLEDGIYGMSPSPLPRMKQLVKLMPAVEAGECTLADINIYLNDIRSARIEADANSKMASEKTIRKCWNLLKEAKQKYPHLEKYPLAQAAYLIHKGETVKPASKANGSEAAYNYARLLAGESVNGKILVDDANYQLMIKDSEILGRLLDQEIVNGQRLIGEIPFNALEWIKANDQEAYQKAIEATTADLKAKAEEKLQAALAEQEKLLREQIYAQLGLTAPEGNSVNPAGLPAPVHTAPTFTPVGVADAVGKDVAEELKAKKKKESDADFLDRMKAFICENKAMDNADYQRLLDMKGKNNAMATELVELFETSPEEPEAANA